MPSNRMVSSYQVPQALNQRSEFDRSFKHTTTLDSGYLVPIFNDEILPGDTISLSTTLFARLATQIVPFMDNSYVEFHLWFVPRRLVWDNWQKFMGERVNPGDSIDFLVPKVTAPTGGCEAQSLLDYIGMSILVDNVKIDACYPRACNLIYNEWYRDENLQDSLKVPLDDGPDDPSIYNLFRRGKRGDYFTNALPSPQKGPAATLPLGQTAAVIGNGKTFGLTNGTSNGGFVAHPSGSGDVIPEPWTGAYGTNVGTNSYSSGSRLSSNLTLGVTTDPEFSGLIADLTTAVAPTINTIRNSIALQQFLEKDMFGGTRYIELIFSHFGVVSPDGRLQRPEFLGSFVSSLNQNTVAQTSQTTQGTNSSPLANLAAYSVFSVNGQRIVHSFTEHGILIGFCQIRADISYQYGIERHLSRETRYDFFWPSLAHLGMQEIKNKEIYAQGTDEDDGIFGYCPRYEEYRTKQNRISGKLNSRYPQSLDYWHLAQKYDSLPKLNSDFIQDKPPFERVIAVQDEPQFILDADFEYYHARPIPMYGTPGLTRI